LNQEHFLIAFSIVKKLQEVGYTAYFAGGWVRDYIMQSPSDDIDIATSARVEDIQSLFSNTIPLGISFGIVVVVEQGYRFEVATFRTDEGYVDGRRPTSVIWANPEEDAKRRDFTINGMFYDPVTREVHDFVGGLKDLKKGIIRTIGNAYTRLQEDKLRMMRAVRYSIRFSFPIDQEALEAISSLAPTLLPDVAMERIWQELKKMSFSPHFEAALILLHQLHLLPTIFPSLKETSLEEIQSLVKNILLFPRETPTILQLLELFPHFSLRESLDLCDYLKSSKSDKRLLQWYHHVKNLFYLTSLWREKLEPLEWAYLYAHPDTQLILELLASRLIEPEKLAFLKECSTHQELLQKAILRIQTKNPVLRAKDLIKEGIKPGKKMGLLLKEAEKISVDQGIDNPEQVIKILKSSSTHWS